MSGDNLYIGIDSGTQGTKGIVLSEKKKRVLAEAYSAYGVDENERGGKEQDPAVWIAACRSVLIELSSHTDVSAGNIKAIGVSGQQHGMVALDKQGEVIRSAKLWCDTETVAQCDTITEVMGGQSAVMKEVGNSLAVGFTASKILWLKEHEPKNYARLETILLPHDYINFWLTGDQCTECGDASGTGYFDIRKRDWSHKVLRAIDGSGRLESCMPELIESDQPAGRVRSDLAEELGLPADVLVSSGGGDNMMAAIGTGNVVPGVVTTSLGTSGTIYATAEEPVIDELGELAAFCSSVGSWLPLICTMNVTVATELTRKLFGFDLAQMSAMAKKADAGSSGVLFLPFFQGERTPALPEATATLAGLTSSNYSPVNICRAAMEGATFGLRYGLEVMKKNGISPTEIRLVGGGAKSSVWQQLVADVFGCKVVTLENEEAGAVGAAIQALWCWKKRSGEELSLVDLTNQFVRLSSVQCDPEHRRVDRYNNQYLRYLDLQEKMFGVRS